jgi:hypothetical protein
MGMSAWFAIPAQVLLLVPWINVVVGLVLLFCPPKNDPAETRIDMEQTQGRSRTANKATKLFVIFVVFCVNPDMLGPSAKSPQPASIP